MFFLLFLGVFFILVLAAFLFGLALCGCLAVLSSNHHCLGSGPDIILQCGILVCLLIHFFHCCGRIQGYIFSLSLLRIKYSPNKVHQCSCYLTICLTWPLMFFESTNALKVYFVAQKCHTVNDINRCIFRLHSHFERAFFVILNIILT